MVQAGMKVSVCIPAYNSPALFRRCLDSVLKQDMHDFEVVVTDDSDSAGVEEVIRLTGDDRVRYHRNSPSLGAPGNWNQGIAMARGQYVKVMHHDDYFSRGDSLRRLVGALDAEPAAAFAFSYTTVHFKKQNVVHLNRPTRTQLRRLRNSPAFLFFRNIVGNPSAVIFRNEPSLRFDASLRWLVDVDLYIRLLMKVPHFAVVPEALVTSVDGEEGQITGMVSEDPDVVIREHLSLFSKWFDSIMKAGDTTLFFEEMFRRFGIDDYRLLAGRYPLAREHHKFFSQVFIKMQKRRLYKAIVKRLLTSRYNKRLFRIERF